MYLMLNIVVCAVCKVGNLIVKNYEILDVVEVSQKGSNDFVINVDKAVEVVIIDMICKFYLQYIIIIEESGEFEGIDQDV